MPAGVAASAGGQLQGEVHAQVVEFLQAATVETDVGQRLQYLQQAQQLLLGGDILAETVGTCLDYFLNLKADSHKALRRFAANFLEHLAFCKPSLVLRCISTLAALLKDADVVVKELAVKAATIMHSRVLYFAAQEQEPAQALHLAELQSVHSSIRGLLEAGCCGQPGLFELLTGWAKVVVLAQTSSPLALKVRVPPDLRGVSCLQDFPDKAGGHQLDLNKLQQQAEELLTSLCNMLDQPPAGTTWSLEHARALLQAVGSIARQRPIFASSVLSRWRKLLPEAKAHMDADGTPGKAPPVERGQLRELIRDEIQRMLASNLTTEHRAELVELLHSTGTVGSLEDLATQAKYDQICTASELAGPAAAVGEDEPKAKRARKEATRVWVGYSSAVSGPCIADDAVFDADALFTGEAEGTCRRFEDYFGLPSQREPAGHVSAPALLASRMGRRRGELARIALTSLSSLGTKRSLLRDRAHERVVIFPEEAPVREKALGVRANLQGDGEELGLFLAEPVKDEAAVTPGEAAAVSSSGSLLQEASGAMRPRPPPPRTRGAVHTSDSRPAPLPTDPAARDSLALMLFREVLESQRRMEKSLLRASLSPKQLASFDFVSRQVALHMAAGGKSAVSHGLQRAMCQEFMSSAFESLKKSSSDGQPVSHGGVQPALSKLVELFYAKFSTDVAKWQESNGHLQKSTTEAAARTPLRDIIEGPPAAPGKPRATFTYAELFELFLAAFEKSDLPKRELRTFLNEIPMVPFSAFKMLEAQLRAGEKMRKMALLTLLSLVENKPSCRWNCLHLLFKMAYCFGEDKPSEDIRFDTIRLIINKVYSASQKPPMRWQLPHLTKEEAIPVLADSSEESSLGWELADEEFIPLDRLRGRCVEDVATLVLRSIAPSTARFAFPVNVPLRLEQLRGDLFKGTVCAPKDRVWLYLALCIKRPVLLHALVETFKKCDQEMKEHLINSIEEAIKYIPVSEGEVFVVVQKASPETERLVLKVLHILMQTSKSKGETLSPAYGEAVTRLYSVTQNPRLLVPVFDLLDRKKLLDFLPEVLKLEVEEVTNAFQQLVRSHAPPLSIPELLTELHHMNNPSENIVPVKCSMQALNILFGMRNQFDPKVYGIVIQALVEEPGPLPTLFMRTVIQVVKELPRLSDFVVMEILPRLVRKEVWGDHNMWRGFMIVLQHTFTSQAVGAARVLAMLPMSQLEDVLVQHPDWKGQIREFVARQPPGAVGPHVRQLLQ